MRIEILYFGVLRDLAGGAEETVELEEGATVGDLIETLRGRTSDALRSNSAGAEAECGLDERLWRSLAVAVNREYASLGAVLREGDEIALLPPVSGGSCAEGEERALLAMEACAMGYRGEWDGD